MGLLRTGESNIARAQQTHEQRLPFFSTRASTNPSRRLDWRFRILYYLPQIQSDGYAAAMQWYIYPTRVENWVSGGENQAVTLRTPTSREI